MDLQRIRQLGVEYLKPNRENQLTPEQLCEVKDWIDDEWERIPYIVRFTDGSPYPDVEMMRECVHNTGVLYISRDGSQSELLGDFHNLRFRAVHDWHHLQCGADFSPSGEWQAYLHAITRTQSRIVKSVLFSEIVLQAAAYHVLGDFPETQKLVLLFDQPTTPQHR